ncbi:MAG: energy transducer TonB [Sphingomicrobium sp.]
MRQFENQKQTFHPRSPVQAGPSSAPYIVAAIIIALAVWTAQQIWFQDEGLNAPPPLAGLSGGAIGELQSARGSGRGDLRVLFTSEDYPVEAARTNQQGTVQARLDVDERGRVTRCSIIRSAGPTLDAATCNILGKRARFKAARNSGGQPVADIVTTPPITWRLEG